MSEHFAYFQALSFQIKREINLHVKKNIRRNKKERKTKNAIGKGVYCSKMLVCVEENSLSMSAAGSHVFII